MQQHKSISRLLPNDTIFLECDIQEKIITHIKQGDTVIHNAKRLA
jgi:nicotinamidase-related amidase